MSSTGSSAHRALQRELEGSGLVYAENDEYDPIRLTRQELAIARLAAGGYRTELKTREIAAEMSISVKTVQFHLGNIYQRLGVHSRLELAQHVISREPSAAAPGDT